jgi:hypothetical protein
MNCKDDTADSANSGEDSRGDSTKFDWSPAAQPSTAIVEAVAAVTGDELAEMPRLYDSIDSEALNALLAPSDGRTDGDVRVSFAYNGVCVLASRRGGIEVHRAGDGDERAG